MKNKKNMWLTFPSTRSFQLVLLECYMYYYVITHGYPLHLQHLLHEKTNAL